MSRPYQVLARKWRPQRFDDVVGQVGVTQTLRNAISRERIAQAYIFSGARGVGKTTTARILAKALNCEHGPTPEPCGTCDACVEITEGRDLDVFEIDAASNTGIDNIREVVISGLSIAPARDRYKVFIIDEVHMLSNSSFNALLKSIEEPPPHVVFMMATTELHKIPETIRSRAQEFEFRTIGATPVASQLEKIAAAEQLEVDADALMLIARAAEGSMRDALSAFDQVIAFAGERITAADVAAVLGLIARDALLDLVQIVADARAADVFTEVGRLVEGGQDLKLVCRELTALVRDLLVVRIDQTRLEDPDLAADAERLSALAARFSREDLLRAFDVLAKAEADIRFATQPRHHLEMALLRWMHLGQLQPLTEVIAALGGGGAGGGSPKLTRPAASSPRPSAATARPSGSMPRSPASGSAGSDSAGSPSQGATAPGRDIAPPRPAPAPPSPAAAPPPPIVPMPVPAPLPVAAPVPVAEAVSSQMPVTADALIEALRKGNRTFFGTALARASFEVTGDRVVITLAGNFEQQRVEARRAWIEETAQQVFGRKLRLDTRVVAAATDAEGAAAQNAQQRLREQAMQSEAVQAMLDVFPAEIRDVEEIRDAE